jgi:hypothetical protein
MYRAAMRATSAPGAALLEISGEAPVVAVYYSV